MPSVTIYKTSSLFGVKNFNKSFYIAQALEGNTLLWSADGEEIWQTDKQSTPEKQLATPRTPIIWIVRSPTGFPKSFRLKSFPPDWNMQINGVECPKGFYESIEFVWSEVTLMYGNYRFQITFSLDERNPEFGNDETKLPTPLIPAK